MDRSAVTLEWMRSFVRVVDRGSLSAVAREHGVGQSTVTRHLADLERALGVSLLNRTTRRVTLTEEGARYLAETRIILMLVDEATDDARSAGGEPVGTVRVSCTGALGVRHVARALFDLQDRYPGINIDFSLSEFASTSCVRRSISQSGWGRYRTAPCRSGGSASPAASWSHRKTTSLVMEVRQVRTTCFNTKSYA